MGTYDLAGTLDVVEPAQVPGSRPLERLTGDRGWSPERYGELVAVMLRRTLVTEQPRRG